MKIFKGLLVFIGIFFIFYLVGSFYSVSFNLSNWTSYSRYVISIISVCSGVFGLVVYIHSYEN